MLIELEGRASNVEFLHRLQLIALTTASRLAHLVIGLMALAIQCIRVRQKYKSSREHNRLHGGSGVTCYWNPRFQ
jgi:hypothetical protein